ncbi:MAG: hypothetical protein KAS12_03505 [Candidatus Aenigmarchaeota archaeon]|nr:hypothetical protein [Candidatus Aenigmarchaeota archaeon]
MTVKKYLHLTAIYTGICWLLWLIVILFIDPQRSGALSRIAFYLALASALVGSFSLFGFIIRIRFNKASIFRQILISWRQSFWLAGIVIFSLLFKELHILGWFNFIFLSLFFVSIEIFFLIHNRRNNVR